jgi:hypothetical protein
VNGRVIKEEPTGNNCPLLKPTPGELDGYFAWHTNHKKRDEMSSRRWVAAKQSLIPFIPESSGL